MKRPDWKDASCRDAPDKDLWFAAGDQADRQEWARGICAQCPIQQECLEYALWLEVDMAPWDIRSNGIWGGLSAKERGEILDARARRKSA